MQFEPFLSDLAEVMETDPGELTAEFPLDDTNWDSLALVSTIALLEEHFHLTVPGDALRECQSVGDLLKLVAERAEGS